MMARGLATSSTTLAAELSVGAKVGGAPMVVVLVSIAHAMSHAYGALLPLIVPFFLSDLHLTYTQVGLIFTISNLVWGPLQLGFGVLGRYQSRKWILGLGHIFQGLSIVGMGLVNSFNSLLFWRLSGRIADAPQHPIGNSLIAQSFGPERRGLGMAINAAGSNLGTVVVPLIGGFLIAAVGWQSTLFLFGIPGIVIGALIIGCLQENRAQTSNNTGMAGVGRELWALVQQRDALLLLMGHVIGAGGRGLGVATLYVPLYLSQALNVDKVQLGMFMTVMMIGSVIGPLLAGPLSDRIGRKPVLLGDYALACLCFASLLMVGNSSWWVLLIVLIITGIAAYSEGAIMQTALADVADKTSMDMLFGMYFTIGSVIGAPWAFFIGKLIDSYGFPAAFLAMGASQVLAGLCVLPVHLRRTTHTATA